MHDLERGLALLTEAKYGFSCHRGDLGVSLLKAARHPDPTADLGRHSIRFALGRHRTVSEPGAPSTACAADALYTPLVVVDAGAAGTAVMRIRPSAVRYSITYQHLFFDDLGSNVLRKALR